jgi:hypothetical protein
MGDPDYIVGNVGGMIIAHFVFFPLSAIVTIPVLVLGAAPFVGICAVVHLINHTAFVICAVVSVLLYLHVLVGKLILFRIIPKLCSVLF